MKNAKDHGIEKLTDYQHARRRTEMYLAARTPHSQNVLLFDEEKTYIKEMTWVPALFTAFREGLDNALDEVIGHGHGNSVGITYHEDTMTFEIVDNGRGIPIDFDKTHNKHIATMVLSETKTGRNFGDRGSVAGTNGLGISVVNYCSSVFSVEILRDGKKFHQEFSEDVLFDALKTQEPTIKEMKSTKTGTSIVFRLSPKVFENMTLPTEFVKARVIEIALSNPQTYFTFNGSKISTKENLQKRLFKSSKPIVVSIDEPKFQSKFYVVPDFLGEGDFTHSLVNNIPAFNGGLHTETFRRMFISGILTALEKEAKRKKLKPNRTDVSEGLLFYNVTTMGGPNFDSQSKTRLINEEAGVYVKNALTTDIFEKIVKTNRDWIESIFERCAERTNSKDADELERESRKLLKKKVSKLIEANSRNRQDCILFITEGDSAMNMSAVRNPEIHAGLPLRGKILNVNGEDFATIMASDTLSDLMSTIGLVPKKKAIRQNLRYGKIFIAHDMDPDGYSIGALLVNFFHTGWPELLEDVENPFLNVFMTPYIIAQKGKQRKYWYGDNYHDFNPEEYKGWAITRAKGLGSLEEEDWEASLANPKLFPITADTNIKESLDLIFNGKRADDRKTWLGK